MAMQTAALRTGAQRLTGATSSSKIAVATMTPVRAAAATAAAPNAAGVLTGNDGEPIDIDAMAESLAAAMMAEMSKMGDSDLGIGADGGGSGGSKTAVAEVAAAEVAAPGAAEEAVPGAAEEAAAAIILER